MPKLMQHDVNVLGVDVLHEIFLRDALAPVAACAAAETRCEPERLICGTKSALRDNEDREDIP